MTVPPLNNKLRNIAYRLDVVERLSSAVEKLNPHQKSPVWHLFAVNGLGKQPRLEASLPMTDRAIT